MGGLAALARAAGHTVTGCDTGVYPPMSDQLRALGIELIEGYNADQLALKPDVWVIGNVVSRARLADGSPRYPLMEAILDAGYNYTSGPQWLAEHILKDKHVLAVAGTHGKTTTSTMLAWILTCAGLNPSFLIGGVPLNFGTSARLTDSPYFVIEADEYDTAFFDKRSKFVHYRPRTAVLNNLEFDHADIFPDLAAIERQFHHLVRTVPSKGCVVVNADEPALTRVLAQGCWSQVVPFSKADARIHQIEWTISGQHNLMNALAAMAAAQHVGVSEAVALRALSTFENVKRRMEIKGTVTTPSGNITVIDDFAHHPTAIATTVEGLRRQLNEKSKSGRGKPSDRILAIFEPRSNTMKLGAMKAALPDSLKDADLAFCHSGGLDWDAPEALSSMGSRAIVVDSVDALVTAVVAVAKGGDHLLCMSNGGFGGIHQKLLEQLNNRFQHPQALSSRP